MWLIGCGPSAAADDDSSSSTAMPSDGSGPSTDTTASTSVGTSSGALDAGTSSGSADTTGGTPPSDDGIGPWGYAATALDIAAREIVLADFDGDAHIDVFAAGEVDGGAASVQVHRGTGLGVDGGAFVADDPTSLAWGGLSAAGDFDGEPGLDVVSFAQAENDTIHTALAAGTGFAPSIPTTPDDSIFPEFGVAVLDVDGDGLDDLLVPQGHGQGVTVELADGAAGFTTGVNLVGPACYVSNSTAADMDGDGFVDAVVTGSCNAVPEVLPLVVYEGDGDTLAAGTMFAEGPGVLEGSDVVAVDLDGDDDLDVVTGAYPNGLSVLVSDAGALAAPEARPLAWDSTATTLLPMQLEAGAAIALLAQDRDGSAAVIERSDAGDWIATPVELGGAAVGAADLDEDGRTDLAVLADGTLTLWFSRL